MAQKVPLYLVTCIGHVLHMKQTRKKEANSNYTGLRYYIFYYQVGKRL